MRPAAEKRGTTVKEAAEAATAVAKALLFFGAIAIVVAVVSVTLWRERHAHRVVVVVDPEAEHALRAMGSRIDLRQTFIDTLNERIRGVEHVFALSYGQLLDTRDAPDVSFKPFGLDASTGEIERIVRTLLGGDMPVSVRIELACAAAKCDDVRGDVVLVATVSDATGSERRAVPVGGSRDGLQRRVRSALDRAAHLLLERNEPLIAAVYDLNAASLHPFDDDRSRDWQHAISSALKLRDGSKKPSCIVDLVIGGSLLMRGSWADGLKLNQRAEASGDPVCAVHAASNVVYYMTSYLCNDDPRVRAFALTSATTEESSVRLRGTAGLDPLVADRIPMAALWLADMQFLLAPDAEPVRAALCSETRVVGAQNGVPTYVQTTLSRLEVALPPRPGQYVADGVLERLAWLAEFGIPRDDVAGRFRTALATMDAVDRYLPTTPLPRRLYAVRGRLATELAYAAIDTLELDAPARARFLADVGGTALDDTSNEAALRAEVGNRLAEARVDFQNALAAESGPAIEGAPTDVALGAALGDASLAVGDFRNAQDDLATTVDAFLASETPTDQIVPLAEAVGRLAMVDQRVGNCTTVKGKLPPRADPRPAQLGFDSAAWCALGSERVVRRPGLAGMLAALVEPTVRACGPIPFASDASPYATVAWLRCAHDNGPTRRRVAARVFGGNNGTATRFTIEDALDYSRPKGSG